MTRLATPSLLLAACLLNLGGAVNGAAAKGTVPPAKKKIVLSAEKGVRSLGGQIPIVVRYVNRTGGPLEFREPAKTWEVQLTVCPPGGKPTEVPFGRIFFYRRGHMERRTIEKAETITLKPGGVHQFACDVGRRWPELFAPGVNRLRIKDLTDDAQTLLSNEIEVRVAYDRATFPARLAIAAEEKSSVDSLRFASDWIARLRPGFQLATPSAGVTEAQREENHRRIAATRTWWNADGNHPETLKRIKSLNRKTRATTK
jgi:hypothetical protein